MHGVANEIAPACPLHGRDDEAIDRGIECRAGRATASVAGGWVTLRGMVDWHCQLLDLEQVARDVGGVAGVTNLLEVNGQTPSPAGFQL
ncbi:MAG: BON domain-containing protein [Chloroflexi bacterium]|nr:BON domain-containing protein [Chloroflexota bacterium]